MKRHLLIVAGTLLVLAIGAGLAFASDSAPTKEPESSPFFEATLQQAVNELDGKARPPAGAWPRAAGPQQAYYTADPKVWIECTPGYTRDLVRWPDCHYTSDPTVTECAGPWPTKDYTWDADIWPACDPTGGGITQDPNGFWCDSTWTHDPQWGPQCDDPAYTRDANQWPWCNPRYTQDPAQWPACDPGVRYTYDPRWPECESTEFTTDPYLWAECHFTSDPLDLDCVPYPTMDYTSNPGLWPECPGPGYTTDTQKWPWCNPDYTTDPQQWDECTAGGSNYTQDPTRWPWCEDPLYTSNPAQWRECHFTSDPLQPECTEPFPTKDYTFDADLWPECDNFTQDSGFMCDVDYTQVPDVWPWCDPAYTWDSQTYPQCQPGYTSDPQQWPVCRSSRQYTSDPKVWDECTYLTADPNIWYECHYTSDPKDPDCDGTWFPTKDYTTDTQLWPRDCGTPPGELGDAPDRTNHTLLPGGNMTAYPSVNARYPTVFDPITGLPQGPLHLQPRADAWLGPTVTLEFDADLLPDQDGLTNVDPPSDTPDRDKGDDGVNNLPLPAPHCEYTWFTYTVTIPPVNAGVDRYVNVWFDWTQDGDWSDIPTCPAPNAGPAPEWAVKNQVIPGSLPAGTYIFATPPYLAWFPVNPDPADIWMRISIAEQKAPKVPTADIADGRGPANGYRYGETEDYFFKPTCPQPVADFVWDPPTICPTTTVQFWDQSTGFPTSWSWDFGGTGTSNLQNPSHSFGAAGSYDVQLTVRNACGSDTITKTVTVIDCPDQDPEYDIYIKDNDSDDGSVPSSGSWWYSPDIWVRTDGDCTQTDHQDPLPGTANTVCVRVRNRMTTTVDNITVSVYYASAALGLTWPGSFSYIDSFSVASLAGGAQIVKSVVWNAPYSAGHFCFRAHLDAPQDLLFSGPDTVSPTEYVHNNNNIALRNSNTVDYPEVTECGFYTTTVYTDIVYFDAVNTTDAAATVDIVFDSSDFPLGSGTLIVEPGSLWGDWTSLTGFSQVGTTLVPTAFPASMDGVSMAAFETARMTMTIAAEIGVDFTVDIEETVNDEVVGGIQYIRDLPNCLYLPLIMKSWSP